MAIAKRAEGDSPHSVQVVSPLGTVCHECQYLPAMSGIRSVNRALVTLAVRVFGRRRAAG
jgi:hypothetical protein